MYRRDPLTATIKISVEDNIYEIAIQYYYTRGHEWVVPSTIMIDDKETNVIIAGLSDYLQEQLGEISIVELMPHSLPGTIVKQVQFENNNPITPPIPDATIESAKTVISLHSPISGEVIDVNDQLIEQPELVNEQPYTKGWLFIINPIDFAHEVKNLMSAEEYGKYIQSF